MLFVTGGGICYALGLLEKSGYWEMQLLNQRITIYDFRTQQIFRGHHEGKTNKKGYKYKKKQKKTKKTLVYTQSYDAL